MASASSQTPTSYDVFLSFRGADTRIGFTSHMYSALDRYSIRTYRDDPELRCGEVISTALLKAIQESKIYIVILSENYASSSWCLNELVEILNCSKTMQRLVIPVFYHLNPSDVRHQTGSFGEHFRRQEKRYAGDQVQDWRLTLRQVADNSGKHVDGKRPEADIVNEIVKEILLRIESTALNVAKYPVGLDSRVKEITAALLSSGTKGVIRIGIYGMGGVGKTTLAKALYNELLLGSFEGSCFLENVREILGTTKGLESLQKQLINDVLKITKDKIEVSSVDKGTKLIEQRICSRKILVVIDDLEDHKKFESLVRPFAPGSVVIITTRDEEIFDGIETQYRYKVDLMGDAESETLFFRHAFGDTEPNNTLMILSTDILHLAGGLPLALEVFGSYLYNRPEVQWKYYIERLQRHPDNSIQQRLIISLDALALDDPHLKNMFLDIACLFIGRKKQNLVEILDTYYSSANVIVDILKKRSLITFNERDELRMHDMLQDMGKNIARNNSPDMARNNSPVEPGKHSRLWVPKEIWDVLKKDEGTEAIEGILLNCFEYNLDDLLHSLELPTLEDLLPYMGSVDDLEHYFESNGLNLNPSKVESFKTKIFKRMSRLRFLYLDGIKLTGKFKLIPEDLRWFCWNQCPLKCLPFDFCPQKLVILELPNSKLTTLWEVSNVLKNLKTISMFSSQFLTTTPDFRRLPRLENLKTLNMSFSRDLTTTPDFRRLPHLENLYLEGCRSLKEVHVSIGSLVRLVSLNLMDCVSLRSLPDDICKLGALEVLCIEKCAGLEALPIELGNIKSLKELNASRTSFPKLPDSIGSLSELVKLDLHRNYDEKELEPLPNTICNLRKLEVLHVTVKVLPHELGNIISLRELSTSGIAVSKMPDTICNLRSLEILHIFFSRTLERLPNQLWKLTSLLELYAYATIRLKKLPDIESSQTSLPLKKLNLTFGKSITTLPSGISQLSNLEDLHLTGCDNLLSIAELPPNLKHIFADDCTSLKRVNLSNLKLLEQLSLSKCSALTDILGLGELASLHQLYLEGCRTSLLARTLTKPLVEIHCGFEKKVHIRLETEEFPDWIIQSSVEWSDDLGQEILVNLQPNLSHNYLGMILCFDAPYDQEAYSSTNEVSYSVMTSASNIFQNRIYGSSVVIVPRSIFTVTDADHTIKFASRAHRHWIHLLYKNEDDSTTVNIADEDDDEDGTVYESCSSDQDNDDS